MKINAVIKYILFWQAKVAIVTSSFVFLWLTAEGAEGLLMLADEVEDCVTPTLGGSSVSDLLASFFSESGLSSGTSVVLSSVTQKHVYISPNLNIDYHNICVVIIKKTYLVQKCK